MASRRRRGRAGRFARARRPPRVDTPSVGALRTTGNAPGADARTSRRRAAAEAELCAVRLSAVHSARTTQGLELGSTASKSYLWTEPERTKSTGVSILNLSCRNKLHKRGAEPSF